jgi:hypothetical protein
MVEKSMLCTVVAVEEPPMDTSDARGRRSWDVSGGHCKDRWDADNTSVGASRSKESSDDMCSVARCVEDEHRIGPEPWRGKVAKPSEHNTGTPDKGEVSTPSPPLQRDTTPHNAVAGTSVRPSAQPAMRVASTEENEAVASGADNRVA